MLLLLKWHQMFRLREDIAQILPMVDQLKAGLPDHFDVLRAGLIETLEEINQGILEAGGDRIEFVRGQLSVFIQQAIEQGFEQNVDKINQTIHKFETLNATALRSLSEQYEEASAGLQRLKSQANANRVPKWIKIVLPIAFIVGIIGAGVLSWQIGSYKEAVYMNAFMSQLDAQTKP